MLHCAMGLATTRKPAIVEDWGEDNKDSDWLSEQALRDKLLGRGREGVLHCATLQQRGNQKVRGKLLPRCVTLARQGAWETAPSVEYYTITSKYLTLSAKDTLAPFCRSRDTMSVCFFCVARMRGVSPSCKTTTTTITTKRLGTGENKFT